MSETNTGGTLDLIIASIQSAVATITHFVEGVVGAMTNVIFDGLKLLAKSVNLSFNGVVSDLLGGIGSVLKGLGSHLLAIIEIIQKALNETNKILNTINKDVIQRFVDPILKTYEEIKQVETDIEAAIKEGLTGILEIPGIVSNALSSASLAYKQAVLLSDKNTSDLVNNNLIPGLGDQIGGHVKNLHDLFKSIYSTISENITEWKPKNLSEPTGIYDWKQEKTELDGFLASVQWPIGSLLKDLWRGLLLFEAQVATFTAYLSQAEQAAKLSTPVEPLPVNDAVNAAHRNLITSDDMVTELGRQGLSADRANILYTLADQLLGVADLVRGNFRGIISDTIFKDEMNNLNYTEGRQQALLELYKFLPDPGLLASLYQRQIITKADFESTLKKNGWEDSTIAGYEALIFRPSTTDTYARFVSRRTQADKGFLADSYKSVGPESLHTLAGMNGQDDTAADLSWLAHWRDMDIFTWINAEYRGMLGDGVFDQAVAAMNFPPEVSKILLEANRPLISFFYVVEMLSAGVFTESETVQYLKRYGFDDLSIKGIIKFSGYKALGKATEANVQFNQLSVANLKAMYDDSIITEGQFIEAMQAHGYDPETATLLVDLYQTAKATKERSAYLTMLVDEVKVGKISVQTALDDLGGKGYSEGEIAKFQLAVRSAQTSKTKLPTSAELKDMYKAEIISGDEYISTLEQLGYSAFWAERIAALAAI